MVRELIFALLGVLIPLLYGWLTGEYPDFPITAENFKALALWIVGLLVGGGASMRGYVKYRLEKALQRREVVKIGRYEIRNINRLAS